MTEQIFQQTIKHNNFLVGKSIRRLSPNQSLNAILKAVTDRKTKQIYHESQ